MSTTPTVYVVDDDPAVLDGIRTLLQEINLPVETFGSAAAFLEQVEPGVPGCLVLDIRMPGMSGLELRAELVDRHYDLPIIIITGHGDIPMAVNAMKSGVLDFMEKPFSPQFLIDRIQKALDQDRQYRADDELRRELRARADALTPREREILDRMLSGKSPRQIAVDLSLSHKTINNHRTRIMRKMEASSVLELARMAPHLRHGPADS